jgi:adenylate cyclase
MRPEPPAPPPSAGATPTGQLVPLGGGDPIPLRKPRLIVGRLDACDIVLRVATISGQHCALEWTDEGWRVRDLGSRNGIKVDGVRCEAKLLTPGSVLSLGGLRYQVVYAAQGAPRPFAQGLLQAAGLAGWQPPEAGEAPDVDARPRQRLRLDEPN